MITSPWSPYLLLAWFAYLQAAPGICHLPPPRRAPPELLNGRIARRGVRGRQHARRRSLRAARTRARAPHAALVGCRGDECGRDRADGRTRRRGDRGLGAGHGRRRWAAARHDPGCARRPPWRVPRGRAGRGQRGGQHRLRRTDRPALVVARRCTGAGGRRWWPRWSFRCWRGRPVGGWRSSRHGRPSDLVQRPSSRRVLDRRRDDLLHDRGRVVHHRLGRDLRRGRRQCADRHRGRA